MIKKLLFLLFILSILISSVKAANCGSSIQCNCGDTLNESQSMWYDLINCPNNGIIISKNNITLDCNNHIIDGVDAIETGSGVNSTFYINTTIKNCRITDFYYGIYLRDSTTHTVKNNLISSNYHGIKSYQSSNNNILNNTVAFQSSSGIELAFWSGGNNIINNNLTKNWAGIYAFGTSGYNNITNNTIISNSWGLNLYSGSGDNMIRNNIIAKNGRGLYLESSSRLTTNNNINQNIIRNNGIGIDIRGSHDNKISKNSINDNGQSILIENDNGGREIYSKNNTIQDNLINSSGIVISYGDGNKIINNIMNNIGGQSIWTENCNNNFTNNIGDDLPIVYANTQTDILNLKVAQIFLCNAHGSIIQNVTVIGSLTRQSNGIFLRDTDNVIISESNSSGNRHGVYISNSNDNIITNNSFFNNSEAGVSIFSGTNNIITNNKFIKNGLYNYGYPLYVNAYVNSAGNIFNISDIGNYWNDFDLNPGYPTKYIITDPIAIDYRPLNDDDNDGYPAWNECNDKNANINPSVLERCNGVDDNCDGRVDENCSDYRPIPKDRKYNSP